MKKDIHPSNYREVVFKDMSNEEIFITRSTIATKETIEVDGVTAYHIYELELRGDIWVIKTEIYKNRSEAIYALYKKE